MTAVLGNSLAVFVGVTLLLMGFAAFMTGQAVAATWRPYWQAVLYGVLLGLVDRFLIFALFDGALLSLVGFLVDTAVLIAVATAAFRITRTHRMVNQYPWLYERAGPFGWREKGADRERAG